MAFGTSLFLIAAGAVLVWGVDVTVEGIDLDAVGVILMAIGAIGFFISALFFASWAPFRREPHVEERTRVVEDDRGRRVA